MEPSETSRPAPLVALITAAGASLRMGRPKALLPWRGMPLLLHQALVLEAAPRITEVIAVTGAHAETIAAARAGWEVPLGLVVCERWREGRSAGLEVGSAAFACREPAGILVVAVDQPLAPEVVGALIDAEVAPDEALVPVQAGRRGHPVVLGGALMSELGRARSYPQGLRDIVGAARVRLVEVASPSIHLDLNTPEAWRAAGDGR